MGIHGLLPFLRSHYAVKANIKDFQGKTVGVDAMCWMHKGAFACSQELVLGQDTDKFVYYFIRMCEVLRYHQVKPVIVFDGAKLPAKSTEEGRRQEVREAARQEALRLLELKRSGQRVDDRELASKCETAIRVTSAMISRLMGALRELSINYLVAPYEADAQLAFMCRKGWVDLVVSEDSDLLAYGCPHTFFKMDRNGDGEHIALPCLRLERPRSALEAPAAPAQATEGAVVEVEEIPDDEDGEEQNTGKGQTGKRKGKKKEGKKEAAAPKKDVNLSMLDSWSPEVFSEFCVLCGSDYNSKEQDVHIKGLGIKTAFKNLCNFGSVGKMVDWMHRDKKWREKLPCTVPEYMARFRSIVAVFWHHIVFDPKRGQCVSIAEAFPGTVAERALPDLELSGVCGTTAEGMEALRIAQGTIDPRTGASRAQEALSPAERATLDRLMQQKRAEQRDFQFQASLREEAAARRTAMSASQTVEVSKGPAQAPSPEKIQVEDPPDQDMDDEEEPPGEMCLLPGDIGVFRAVAQDLAESNQAVKPSEHEEELELETPPKEPNPADNRLSPPRGRPSNPFARKRSAQPSSGPPLKRPSLASQVASQPRPSQAPTVTLKISPESAVPRRTFQEPVPRPRGGYAAEDAANRVLAHRGLPQLSVRAETQDRGKITAFIKVAKSAPKVTVQEVTKNAGLPEWNPRPWEVDEEPDQDKENDGANVLSLKASRGRFNGVLMRRGWNG